MTDPQAMDRSKRARPDSVLRVIHEQPGLSAQQIGLRLGNVSARQIRERIRCLRGQGQDIIIGLDGYGYYLLSDVTEPAQRAAMVKSHRCRSREYLIDHAQLMKQISGMAAEALGEQMLFDLTVPLEESERAEQLELGPDDLASLPVNRRVGYFRVLCQMLDRLAKDPTGFAAERAVIADKFGKVFITRDGAAKLAQARKLLEEVGV